MRSWALLYNTEWILNKQSKRRWLNRAKLRQYNILHFYYLVPNCCELDCWWIGGWLADWSGLIVECYTMCHSSSTGQLLTINTIYEKHLEIELILHGLLFWRTVWAVTIRIVSFVNCCCFDKCFSIYVNDSTCSY